MSRTKQRNQTQKLSKLIAEERQSVEKADVNEDTVRFQFGETLKYGSEFYKEKSRFPKTILFIDQAITNF